ncbi:phage holin family protein [Capnocytophaga sp. ARDL2]|uniref:phage holin family protein n=1 Tax=Capnocytophaga sp. ARDL2 TaxID=3238809 RepID=UPI0035565464
MNTIINWILSAVIVYVLANFLPGASVDSFGTSIIVVLVLSIFNLVIKPVLQFVSIPITFLTLGLFNFLINTLIVWMVSGIVDGFELDGFWVAFLFSFILSIVQTLVVSKD